MTINDVMIRDMAEADRERETREKAVEEWRRDLTTRRDGLFWNITECVATFLIVALLVMLVYFLVSEDAHKFPRFQDARAATAGAK